MRLTPILLLFVSVGTVRSEIKGHFDVSASQAKQAAIKAIQSRSSLAYQDDEHVTFICKKDYGTIRFEKAGSGTDITIKCYEHDPSSERKMMSALTDAVAGKQPQEDPDAREHAGKFLAKIERARGKAQSVLEPPVAARPASIVIQGTLAAVKSALVAECATRGMAITSESDHQLTVSRLSAPDQNGAWLFSKILIGNYTAQAYRANVQFTLVESASTVAISTLSEVLVQNGFGAVTRVDTTNNPQGVAALQALLDAVSSRLQQSGK